MNSRTGILAVLAVVALVAWWINRDTSSSGNEINVMERSKPPSVPAPLSLAPAPALVEDLEADSLTAQLGVPTPQAVVEVVVDAFARDDFRALRRVCVTAWDAVPESWAARVTSLSEGQWTSWWRLIREQGSEQASFVIWRLSLRMNYSNLLMSENWRTAEVGEVSLSRDEIHAQITLGGEPATLIVKDVVHESFGWVSWSPEPFELRFAGRRGVVIR